MLAVEPRGLHRAQEELRAVRVRARVRHGEHAGAGVLELEVFIRKLLAVDGLAARAVVVREVAALAHETGDHAVEARLLVAEALLAGAQRAEVLGGLRHDVCAYLHHDPAGVLVADGHVMVGVSGGEFGIRGFVMALDAETGEISWKTYTIPELGEFGNDTWPGDSWQTGGAPVWVTGTYDPELNLSFWGTGNPGPWIGDVRPGDNLYTNSVVALDVTTGELKGYHQYHWNGSWDWDEVSTPLLIDVEREGRTFPALVHPGRNGYLWLLERSADEISFVDAWPYVRQDVFTSIDPESGRPSYDAEKKPGIGFRAPFCPSLWGGKDWPPAAYNPGTALLYIPVNENLCGSILGREVEYEPGRSFTGAESQMTVWPGAEHIGELQAWDMNTGEEVWTREFESPNWGPVLTTAGNLVFMGGTTDRKFRAFDARTGDQLWEHGTNSGVIGVPSTYMIDGVQYVAVQSGWGVDAASMTRRINRDLGTEIFVPEGGVIWVFALQN